jgi:hypothetical protein
VLSRLMCIEEPLPASKPMLKEIAQQLAPGKHAGDFGAGHDGSRRHDLHAALALLPGLPLA